MIRKYSENGVNYIWHLSLSLPTLCCTRTHTHARMHAHTHSARGIAALKDFLTVTLCCLFLILFARVFKPCQYKHSKELKHSNKGRGKAQTSACAPCSVRMQKAASHRQQDQTELSFASSCTWTKNTNHSLNTHTEKDVKELNSAPACSVLWAQGTRKETYMSQIAWTPNWLFLLLNRHIQNCVKIPKYTKYK